MATETARTPTRVVQYSYMSGRPRPVAEFRWSPEAGVTLTVIDADQGGGIARRYYEKGAPFEAERRSVPRDEGEAFMRALVEARQSTFMRFVDESDREA